MAAQDQLSKLPVASLIAILAAAVTAVLWNRVPLEVPRPKAEHIEQHRPRVLQDIDARLWEDPLAVAARHDLELKERKLGPREVLSEAVSASAMCTKIMGEERDARLLILGVMISNARYFDISEHRSRNRYAVHLALSAAHFVPDDSQHIGRFAYQQGKQKTDALLVPFEAFQRRPRLKSDQAPLGIPFRVLVLWIEEERFAMAVDGVATPIANVHHLVSAVQAGCPRRITTPKNGIGQGVFVDSAVIGPVTSDTLRAMVIEAETGRLKAISDQAKKYNANAPAWNKEGLQFLPEHYPIPAFYSAFATSSAIDLLALETDRPRIPCPANGKQPWPMSDWRAQYRGDPRYTGSALYWYFRRCDVQFYSTVATDEELAHVLIDELQKRDPGGEGVHDEKYRVALVYERDTYYGRSLPRAFLRAAGKESACEDDPIEVERMKQTEPPPEGTEKKEPCTVLLYSYLRGLDGQAPPAPPVPNKKPNSDTKAEAMRIAAQEPAEGPKQFDYLRRLSVRILNDDGLHQAAARGSWWTRMGRYGDTQIRAIGVFGTDIYDKIAVLRALRSEFPRAVFFTTDLDARMLDVDQNEWTRNVVVASSMGLELTPCLQKDAPPFRGTYQTSAYLAARLAVHNAFPYEETGRAKWCPQYPERLRLPPHTGEPLRATDTNPAAGTRLKLTQATVDKWLATPRLFEIGRTAPLALLDTPPRNQEAVGDIHPEADRFVPSTPALLTGLVVFGLLVCGLLLLRRVRTRVVEAWEFTADVLQGHRGAWGWRVIVVVVVLVLVALEALLLFAYGESTQRAGEPFRWFEGLSIWPSEILRSIALGMSVVFLFAVCRHSEKNLRDIEDRFALPDCSGTERGWGALVHWLAQRGRGEKAKREATSVDLEHSVRSYWCDYTVLSSPEACLLRAVLWTVIFVVVGIALMEVLGYPNLPARGAAAARLDQFLIFTLTPGFLILLLVVADLNRMCDRFSDGLDPDWFWPEETVQKILPTMAKAWAVDNPIGRRVIGVWIRVQLLVERSKAISPLVILPLTVLVFIVVARAGLFDGWGMPAGMALVLAASFLVCCVTALLVHRTAERVRAQSIQQLQTCLLECQNRSASAVPTPDQIKNLMQRIENLREGAFVPPWERPIVVAGLLPLLGVGGLQFLQVLGLIPS